MVSRTRLGYDGSVLRIGAPNRFFLEWIRATSAGTSRATCCDVLGKCPALEYHLDSASTEGDHDSMQAVPANGTAKPAAPAHVWLRRHTPAPMPLRRPIRLLLCRGDDSRVSTPSSPARAIASPSPRPR